MKLRRVPQVSPCPGAMRRARVAVDRRLALAALAGDGRAIALIREYLKAYWRAVQAGRAIGRRLGTVDGMECWLSPERGWEFVTIKDRFGSVLHAHELGQGSLLLLHFVVQDDTAALRRLLCAIESARRPRR